MNICLLYFTLTASWCMYTLIYMYIYYIPPVQGESFVYLAIVFILAQRAIITKLFQVYTWLAFIVSFLVRKFIALLCGTKERRRIHFIKNDFHRRALTNSMMSRRNNIAQQNSRLVMQPESHRRESLQREIEALNEEIFGETSVIRRRHLEGRRNRLQDDLNRMN